MECTSSRVAGATLPPTPVRPSTLLAAFAGVPHPRRQASVTYPVAALLALAVTALLAKSTEKPSAVGSRSRLGAAPSMP